MYFSRFIQLCFLLAAWNIQILNLVLSCSRWTQDLMACLMNLLRHLQRNKTLGIKSVITTLETVATTLTPQTLMMLMLYHLLMLKLMKNLLGKSKNAEDKQIWVSACVCVVIFMHVKTRRQRLVSLKLNPNKYVSIWHRRKR